MAAEVWRLVMARHDHRRRAEVPTVLGYRPTAPWEVTARFIHAGDPADVVGDRVWTVGRDLLRAGLDAPTGDGDVRVAPAGREVRLSLSSPDGYAVLFLPARGLRAFLDATARAVSPGAEEIDLDVVCAALRRAA